jgi:hypothetical protein
MASLSNINGLFDVHSTGAILFSTSHGTSGQILRSNGNAAPTWVAASTVIGGPYLPLTGGTLSGATATATGINFTVGGNLFGTSATFSGDLTVTGNQYFNGEFIEGDGKEMFRYSNTWLRINEDNDFTSGIYCGTGILRTDGEFQVGGSGSNFKVTSAGVVSALGNITAPSFNGLAINTTGTNNLANQIVRTDVNGYVNFGWINSISGATTSTITRITASNDAYLRYVTPATFRTQITDPYYAPAGTVSGVTSVATGNGLTGGTITSTGTLTMSGTYSGSMQFSGAHGSSQVGCQLPAANNGANTGVVNLRMWCSEPGVTWDWAGFGYNVTNNNGSPSGFGRLNTAFGQAYQRYSSSGNMYFYNTNTAGARVTTLTLSSNGQATFGYTVTAPTFVGALTGNATTASSAAQVTINYNNNSNANYQMLWGSGNNVYGTAGVVVNALSNTVTATTFSGSLSGNASTSTTFNTGRTNYKGVTDAAVIGQMMWKNYGNNHTIFDASSGTSPQGNVISNTNSINAWGATYPTLMGWNGSSTYGVRVDSARVADSTTGSAGTLTHNANRVDSSSYPVVWMSGSPSPAYSCAAVTITSSAGRINATALQFNYTQHGSANNIRMGNSTTMNAISSGTNNAAFGVEALGGCSTGSRNFAYGYAALYSLSSGGSNIAMGDATGYNVTSGSNNLLFGQNAGRTGYQSPYQSIAGVTSGSNQIHMGNESHSTARIQISWTVNSDSRDKTDVTPIDVGLDFVKDLNPVTFRWDKRSDYEDRIPTGKNKLEELTLGFLAQEVEEVEKSYGYDVANKTNLVVDRDVDQDHFGITYEKMIPILVKAIQELEIRVKELENK